jgi:alkyldihydroxyacetonephosphate synthase
MLETNQQALSLTPETTHPHKWGFDDTKFVINSDYSVTMTGNRYPLSGCQLNDFIPYVEQAFGIKIDYNDCKLELTEKIILPAHVNGEFVAEIESCFAANQYSLNDQERLLHSHGQSGSEEVYKVLYSQLERSVDMVFYCESETDAQKLIHIATKHNVCLVPFGGGTNVSCALKLPKNETRMIVAVDMRRMNKIEWIDKENLCACVQAGITGRQLETILQASGFTCGHEPDSLEFSTLGGWIATNASGMKKNRYGNIEQIVENITMITPSGILAQKQNFSRVSTGTQIHHLLFGSEGNFGLITKAVIKIYPLPEVKEYNSIVFPHIDDGIGFLKKLAETGTLPASIRLVDNKQFRFGQALKTKTTGFKKLIEKLSKFYLFQIRKFQPEQIVAATIVFEGSAAEVNYQKSIIKNLVQQYGGMLAGSQNGQRGYMLTFAIAYIRDFFMNFHMIGETFETTVPWNKIKQVCDSVEEKIIAEHAKYKIPGKPYLSYRITQLYHTSVCIYFTCALYTKGLEKPEEILSAIEHSLRETIMENGGSISHHHGVGKIRSHFIEQTASPSSIELVKQLKEDIDPQNIFGIKNNVLDN